MSFLTAKWEQLLVANYAIDPVHLQKYVPAGTSLDLFEGKCYVSLVGFMFTNTKVFGLQLPGHINFEEVNLRFYVKRIDDGEVKRGVVFVKEIVPKRIITMVANGIYKENYETFKMKHRWEINNNTRNIQYSWGKTSNDEHCFECTADVQATEIVEGSIEEFILEHYWGYAQIDTTSSMEYEVRHPKWRSYKVAEYTINVDFGVVYGPEFAFLNSEAPSSVLLAEGSKISVETRKKLKNQ